VTHKEEQIALVIKHFLHKNKELCVAGLGRFMSEEQACVVDPVAKFIYPASHKVNFDPGDFETTPEFITYLENYSGITKAVEKLANFGKLIKAEILSGKKLEIEGLGFFKLNVLGELDFEPIKNSNFNSNSFGLKPVHFAANLLKVKRLEVVSEEDEADNEIALMRESALKELKVMLDHAKIAESTTEVKANKIFSVVATVLTLILIVNLGFFLFNGNLSLVNLGVSRTDMLGKTGEVLQESIAAKPVLTTPTIKSERIQGTSSVNVENNYNLTFKHIGYVYAKDSFEFDSLSYSQLLIIDSLSVVIDSIAESHNNEITVQPTVYTKPSTDPTSKITTAEKFELDNLAPEMLNADAKENGIVAGFYVVAGAFKQNDNASKLVLRLRKAGHKEAITLKPEKYPYHIAAFGRFPTLNGALNEAESLQAKGKKVWIYCAF
jgi:cell division septation protein DedD